MENNTLNPATGFHELYNVTCISLQPSMLPCNKSHLASLSSLKMSKYLAGWWFQPLWKILVSWDDYSQYMGEKMIQTTKHLGKLQISLNWNWENSPYSRWFQGLKVRSLKFAQKYAYFHPWPMVGPVVDREIWAKSPFQPFSCICIPMDWYPCIPSGKKVGNTL